MMLCCAVLCCAVPCYVQVAERIAEKGRSSPDPAVRMYCRMTLSKLSRGGGNGDEIRMGILNIMRDFGIKEGNRGVS
jgi:alpha-glucan,water dikinase